MYKTFLKFNVTIWSLILFDFDTNDIYNYD